MLYGPHIDALLQDNEEELDSHVWFDKPRASESERERERERERVFTHYISYLHIIYLNFTKMGGVLN